MPSSIVVQRSGKQKIYYSTILPQHMLNSNNNSTSNPWNTSLSHASNHTQSCTYNIHSWWWSWLSWSFPSVLSSYSLNVSNIQPKKQPSIVQLFHHQQQHHQQKRVIRRIKSSQQQTHLPTKILNFLLYQTKRSLLLPICLLLLSFATVIVHYQSIAVMVYHHQQQQHQQQYVHTFRRLHSFSDEYQSTSSLSGNRTRIEYYIYRTNTSALQMIRYYFWPTQLFQLIKQKLRYYSHKRQDSYHCFDYPKSIFLIRNATINNSSNRSSNYSPVNKNPWIFYPQMKRIPFEQHVHNNSNSTIISLRIQSLNLSKDNDSNNVFFQRVIQNNDEELYEIERNNTLNQWEIEFDNDIGVNEKYSYDNLDFGPDKCTRPKWSYDIHVTCNQLHETVSFYYQSSVHDTNNSTTIQSSEYNISYLAHGYYRDSFVFTNNVDEFVMKSLRYEHKPDITNFMLIHAEAITYDVLSSSSRIANMYSFCGDTVLIERGYEIEQRIIPKKVGQKKAGFMLQSDLDKIETYTPHPMNNISIDDKLSYAIQIVEGIAEQHGYYKGIMMNDDIEVKQWLRRLSDNTLFLNDVGNTLFRSYDGTGYCSSWVQYGGDFKSPEEYIGSYVDESADIWPIGNIIYTLLTGLHPYHNIISNEQSDIWNATKHSIPYIHPKYKTSRSLIEQRLVEIMELCHQHDPKKRPTIFEIVQHLHTTKSMRVEELETVNQSTSGHVFVMHKIQQQTAVAPNKHIQ